MAASSAQRFWTRKLLAGVFGVAEGSLRDGFASEDAVAAFARTLTEVTSLADLAGRLRMVIAARAAQAGKIPAPEGPLVIPSIPFSEAIGSLASRVPELASDARTIAEIYEDRGFALARSASLAVTERVQKAIVSARERGEPRPSTVEAIADIGDWSRGYAENVYRTNVATASTEGRFQQARKTKGLIPAFEYLTMRDVDVRGRTPGRTDENHWALHGFVAAVDSATWDVWAPPGGFQCRCFLRPMTRDEVQRRGQLAADGSVVERPVPGAARFADGFGGRNSQYGG